MSRLTIVMPRVDLYWEMGWLMQLDITLTTLRYGHADGGATDCYRKDPRGYLGKHGRIREKSGGSWTCIWRSMLPTIVCTRAIEERI